MVRRKPALRKGSTYNNAGPISCCDPNHPRQGLPVSTSSLDNLSNGHFVVLCDSLEQVKLQPSDHINLVYRA